MRKDPWSPHWGGPEAHDQVSRFPNKEDPNLQVPRKPQDSVGAGDHPFPSANSCPCPCLSREETPLCHRRDVPTKVREPRLEIQTWFGRPQTCHVMQTAVRCQSLSLEQAISSFREKRRYSKHPLVRIALDGGLAKRHEKRLQKELYQAWKG